MIHETKKHIIFPGAFSLSHSKEIFKLFLDELTLYHYEQTEVMPIINIFLKSLC